jgi:Flp pilus assembly protein protease CpaA
MGTIALIIFVLTYSAGLADLRTLVVGAALTVIGLVFRRRGAPVHESEPARFRTVRKLMRRTPAQEEEPDEDSL